MLEAVPLWNDRRTRDLVEKFQRDHTVEELSKIKANPTASAIASVRYGVFTPFGP